MTGMKTLSPLAVLLPLLATPLDGEPKKDSGLPAKANPKALSDAGFTALFDGKTLKGWRKAGGTGKYKVEDDAIVGYGKNIRGNTFLCSEKSYRDFIFLFQFRFADPYGHSG